VTGSAAVNAAIRGAVGSIITQGVDVATGLQKKFDWAGVAAAGVGAGIGQLVSDALPGAAHYESPHALQIDYIPATPTNLALSGMAGTIASAATRSLVNGSDFGDNIVAALPDMIGNIVQNFMTAATPERDDAPVTQDASGSPAPSPASSDSSPAYEPVFGDRRFSNARFRRGPSIFDGPVPNLAPDSGYHLEISPSQEAAFNARIETSNALTLAEVLNPEIVTVTASGSAPSAAFARTDTPPPTVYSDYMTQQLPIFERPVSRIIETTNVTFCPTTIHIPMTKSQSIHNFLNVLGAVPVVGAIPMVVDAGMHASEGHYGEAALSLSAALIGAVDGDATLTRMGLKAAKEGVEALNDTKGVYFFDKEVLPYIDRGDATLGRTGEAHFFMPAEDSPVVIDAESAYRYSGGAPSLERAYTTGGNVYGVGYRLRQIQAWNIFSKVGIRL